MAKSLLSVGTVNNSHNKQVLTPAKKAGCKVNPLRGFSRQIWSLAIIMNISRRHDTYFSISLLSVVMVVVMILGNTMYIGIWYYLAISIAALFIAWGFKSPPLFQTGSVLGVSVTFLIYLSLNWSSERPEGLLALGHLFSLPGAAVGLALSAYIVNIRSIVGALIGLVMGSLGVLTGFFINQVVVCNTIMWCGVFSV